MPSERIKRTSLSQRDRDPDVEPEDVVREAWGIEAAPTRWNVNWSYTGKAFARLDGQSGSLCLRRLPADTSRGWLQAIHGGVTFLERQGFGLFPRFVPSETGETIVRFGGQYYDLCHWAEGEAPRTADLGIARLGSLGATVARLHLAGRGAPGPIVRFDWQTDRQRLTMRLAWDPTPHGNDSWQDSENLAAFFESPAIPDEPGESAREARAVLEEAPAALRWLDLVGPAFDLGSDPLTLTHGDLWADHVWFAGEQVSALLDPDTLALRSPLGDLAALCADFGSWDVERCRAMLSGYRAVRPISRATVEALPRLATLRTLGVLRARLRSWREARARSASTPSLDGPILYWRNQLRVLVALDPEKFGRATD
jgi:Ser/Thr protein kinase RdoA (MazF antagonist)